MQLGDLCEVLDYKRKPITKKDRVAGTYPYYGATGVLDFVEGFLFDEPLVLVGEDGAKWGSGDSTAFAVEGKIWVNNHAHVLKPDRNILLDSWLIYHLNHLDLTQFISGLTVPKLNQGSLRGIAVPLPPISEQQRIVGILDEAFAGIATAKANAEKNLQNARQVFKAQLTAVFNDNLGEFIQLEKLFDIGSSKRVLKSEWKSAGVPFYRGREVTRLAADGCVDNELFISDEHYARLAGIAGVPSSGDIVVTAIGTIGNAYVVKNNDRFYFKDASVLWMKRVSDISSEFVSYWIRSSAFHDQLDRGNGATVDTLTIAKLKSLEIPVLSEYEQLRRVEELRSFEQETQRLESIYQRKLAALDALKQSLLHQAFSGQL
ncbi:restriction endonuclease subunit S [Novilysobacter antarcticus]|uniref:restriction endonuclease subunit S n=1 Tax=Novilysobacter antarcticus TaxID=2862543 RepID=UPI001FEC5EE7|nr:restriction endonuclease subunit S [Lysobacter antarcticus]